MAFQTQSPKARAHAAAFTLIEIIIVLAVMTLLTAVAVAEYAELRDAKQVEQAVQTLAADLESARADALAGKHGAAHGIKFSTTRYEKFVGDTYPGTFPLVTTTTGPSVELSTTLPGDEAIVFDRLTGATGATATVTAALASDYTVYKQIVITPRGVVQLVE